jgi:tetratricopeptide (TPR) repeat protein
MKKINQIFVSKSKAIGAGCVALVTIIGVGQAGIIANNSEPKRIGSGFMAIGRSTGPVSSEILEEGALLNQIELRFNRGDRAGAILELEELFSAQPENESARSLLARFYNDTGDSEKATSLAKQAYPESYYSPQRSLILIKDMVRRNEVVPEIMLEEFRDQVFLDVGFGYRLREFFTTESASELVAYACVRQAEILEVKRQYSTAMELLDEAEGFRGGTVLVPLARAQFFARRARDTEYRIAISKSNQERQRLQSQFSELKLNVAQNFSLASANVSHHSKWVRAISDRKSFLEGYGVLATQSSLDLRVPENLERYERESQLHRERMLEEDQIRREMRNALFARMKLRSEARQQSVGNHPN